MATCERTETVNGLLRDVLVELETRTSMGRQRALPRGASSVGKGRADGADLLHFKDRVGRCCRGHDRGVLLVMHHLALAALRRGLRLPGCFLELLGRLLLLS